MTITTAVALMRDHAAWLADRTKPKPTFRGANLCNANLRGADLCGANLWGANLRGANLWGANLRGADLCGADLCNANLCNANLCNANLCNAVGVLALPVAEPRRYRWIAVTHSTGWIVAAGCRWFTIPEARAHWLAPDYSGPREVRGTVSAALDWLERQPRAQKGNDR